MFDSQQKGARVGVRVRVRSRVRVRVRVANSSGRSPKTHPLSHAQRRADTTGTKVYAIVSGFELCVRCAA